MGYESLALAVALGVKSHKLPNIHCTFAELDGTVYSFQYQQGMWMYGSTDVVAGKRIVTTGSTWYATGSYSEWIAEYGWDTGGWW